MVPNFEFDSKDFIALLAAAPCTLLDAQGYIRAKFNVRVPRSSYKYLWQRLEEQLGTEGAADAVCEVALTTASEWVNELLTALEHGGRVERRADGRKIAKLLIGPDGEATELGRYMLDYRVRTGRAERTTKDDDRR